MTEIRPREDTPQLATALYEGYLACRKYITVGGERIPASLEEAITATMGAVERTAGSPPLVPYEMLCRWAWLMGRGAIMENPEGVGNDFVSTPVRYFIDTQSRIDLDVCRTMEANLERPLEAHERPLLMDRPVILTMCRGEAADKALSVLREDGGIRLYQLLGKGLAPCLYPVDNSPSERLGYHR